MGLDMVDAAQVILCLAAGEAVLLTCCLSTRFFTPSMTNWEPVFITLENSLQGRWELGVGGRRKGGRKRGKRNRRWEIRKGRRRRE